MNIAISGLKGSGKTVFLTNLLNYLLAGVRVNVLQDLPEYRFTAGGFVPYSLVPDPQAAIPTLFPGDTFGRRIFSYPRYVEMLTQGRWPDATDEISQFPCKVTLQDLQSARTEERRVNFLDFPGEYLCDLLLLNKTFAEWSAETLLTLALPPYGGYFRAFLEGRVPEGDEFRGLRDLYARGFREAYENGFYCLSPMIGWRESGRECMGMKDREFFPTVARGTPAYALCERNFEIYRQERVKPFAQLLRSCRKHLFLVDVFSLFEFEPALNQSHASDQMNFITRILGQFGRPSGLWERLVSGPMVKEIHFIATKADLFHPDHRPVLTTYLEDLLSPVIRNLTTSLSRVSSNLVLAALASTRFERKPGDGWSVLALNDCDRRDREYLFTDHPPAHLHHLFDYRYCLDLPPGPIQSNLMVFPHWGLDRCVFEIVFDKGGSR